MNGPQYLRSAGDLDVVTGVYIPTFIDEQRIVVYDGKRGYVSPENFEWMKTAGPQELGAMRVIRIRSDAPTWMTRPTEPPL